MKHHKTNSYLKLPIFVGFSHLLDLDLKSFLNVFFRLDSGFENEENDADSKFWLSLFSIT